MEAQASVLTPPGIGAIGVVLLSGTGARRVLEQAAGTAAARLSAGKLKRTTIRTRAGETVDDAVLACLDAEHFELHLHGGPAVMERVMATLAEAGAESVSPQEGEPAAACSVPASWQRPIAREVLAAVPQAQTPTALRLLAAQAHRGLEAWAHRWEKALTAGAALWEMQAAAQWTMDRSEALRRLREMPRVALVGPPNAGKSTLANALLGRTVSITSATAGTTRDWVDATLILAPQGTAGTQVAVTLVDTAGVRNTTDPIERESIARTQAQAAAADVVVAVVDASETPDEATRHWLATLTGIPAAVLAMNKADRGRRWPVPVAGVPAVTTSGLEGTGLGALAIAILAALELADPGEEEPWAFTPRQRACLQEAAMAATAEEAAAALHRLREGSSASRQASD